MIKNIYKFNHYLNDFFMVLPVIEYIMCPSVQNCDYVNHISSV